MVLFRSNSSPWEGLPYPLFSRLLVDAFWEVFWLFFLVICKVDIACILGVVCSALSAYFLLIKCWGPKVKTLGAEGSVGRLGLTYMYYYIYQLDNQ